MNILYLILLTFNLSIAPVGVLGASYENTMWLEVQSWRMENNKPAYLNSEVLCNLARIRVEEIKTDWSHNGFYKHTNMGFEQGFTYLGENLARGFVNPQDAMTTWLNSPTHRSNLDAEFTHGCIICSDTYCAHEFGKY